MACLPCRSWSDVSYATYPTDVRSPTKVSEQSLWSDPQWQFDGLRPGLRLTQLRFDWDFQLPDGSRFTAPCWSQWLHDAQTFLWSLRVDPPRGRRRLRARSLVTVGHKLRVLIGWMADEGMRGFGALDRENAQRFLSVVAERITVRGNAVTPNTRHAYANVVAALWLQRHKLADPPPDDPFDGERASAFSGFCGLAAERWPFTPDAIAVSHFEGNPSHRPAGRRPDRASRPGGEPL
jgi:hypothetical protein